MRRFKKDHRGARKAWDVPLDFPNWRVVEAYTRVRVTPGIRRLCSACFARLWCCQLPLLSIEYCRGQ